LIYVVKVVRNCKSEMFVNGIRHGLPPRSGVGGTEIESAERDFGYKRRPLNLGQVRHNFKIRVSYIFTSQFNCTKYTIYIETII
jgi:hypothetical protein